MDWLLSLQPRTQGPEPAVFRPRRREGDMRVHAAKAPGQGVGGSGVLRNRVRICHSSSGWLRKGQTPLGRWKIQLLSQTRSSSKNPTWVALLWSLSNQPGGLTARQLRPRAHGRAWTGQLGFLPSGTQGKARKGFLKIEVLFFVIFLWGFFVFLK